MLTLNELKRRLALVDEQIKIAQKERDRLRVARHRYRHAIKLYESTDFIIDTIGDKSEFDESD